jgi:hypothetical protein
MQLNKKKRYSLQRGYSTTLLPRVSVRTFHEEETNSAVRTLTRMGSLWPAATPVRPLRTERPQSRCKTSSTPRQLSNP